MKRTAYRSAIEKWNTALELQDQLRTSSLQLDRRSSRQLLAALARGNAWRAALSLRNSIEEDILSVNACIRGCAGQWEKALWYLADAEHDGIEIDIIAYTTTLGVCGWSLVLGLLDEVEAHGLRLDMISYGRAVTALQKHSRWAGSLDILREFIGGARDMSLILCNAAISSCESGGKWQLALDFLHRRGADLDIISYNAAISSCEKASQWRWAMHLFEQVPRRSLQRDLITFSAGISAFEKSTRWQEALILYSKMLIQGLRTDVVACNAMMSACEKAGQWEQALVVMLELMRMRLKATATTTNALLSSFQKGNEWRRALSLLIDLKPEVDLISYNAVIAACIDHWIIAISTFADLHLEPDLVTYTSLVSACGRGQQWEIALSLAHSSPQRDPILDISTLTNCSKATQWQAALNQFKELRQRREDIDADAYEPLLQAALHADAMSKYLSQLECQALDLLKPFDAPAS